MALRRRGLRGMLPRIMNASYNIALEAHYAAMLGLDENWKVGRVHLNIEGRRLDIFLEYVGKGGVCPDCGERHPLHDHAPAREWRHLDAMQFATYLHASLPRVNCPEHGAKTIVAPWAGPGSRFTLLFEAFAILALRSAQNIKAGCKLLNLRWGVAMAIMDRAVKRGMARRKREEIPWVGLDEKSFGKATPYATVLCDIDGARVLDLVPGRSSSAADEVIRKALDDWQREMVCGIAMDMSGPYLTAAQRNLPNADVVYDRFHVMQHMCEAVDMTRRQEYISLKKEGDRRLDRSRYLFLTSPEKLRPAALERLEALKASELKSARVWGFKELLRKLWDCTGKPQAERFMDYWIQEALKTRLRQLRKVARMLRTHAEGILAYFESPITNAVSEGFNSEIQRIKSDARGFRSLENYRTAILFHCGKLDLQPL